MSGGDQELAVAILEPHYDAVRDAFVEYEAEPGIQLDRLRRTRMVVDPSVHDNHRHYAMCREDGLLIKVAPESVELPWEDFVAVIVHEFGHAADFAYPGCWIPDLSEDGGAVWIGGRRDKPARAWRRLWNVRGNDQVEMAADSIAYTVTGKRVRYCGPCMIQCFSGGQPRPEGLR